MLKVITKDERNTFTVNLTISVELSPSNLLSMAALQEVPPNVLLHENKVFSLSSIQIEDIIRSTVTDSMGGWMEVELENIADEAICEGELKKLGFTDENETTAPSEFTLIIEQ